MPLDTQGFDGIASDIAGMAGRMDADGAGAPVARRILEAAAQPIHRQMKANASKDPQNHHRGAKPLHPHRPGEEAPEERKEHHHRRAPQGGRRVLRHARGVRARRPRASPRASLYPSRLRHPRG